VLGYFFVPGKCLPASPWVSGKQIRDDLQVPPFRRWVDSPAAWHAVTSAAWGCCWVACLAGDDQQCPANQHNAKRGNEPPVGTPLHHRCTANCGCMPAGAIFQSPTDPHDMCMLLVVCSAAVLSGSRMPGKMPCVCQPRMPCQYCP
jgi:hypothetical protein